MAENENAKNGIAFFNPVSGLLALIRRLREALADWFSGNTAAALAVRTKLDEIEEAVEKLASLSERDQKLYEKALKDTEVLLSGLLKVPEIQDSAQLQKTLGEADSVLALIRQDFPTISSLDPNKTITEALLELGDILDVKQSQDGSVLFVGSEKTCVLKARDISLDGVGSKSLMYRWEEVPAANKTKEIGDVKWTPWQSPEISSLVNELTMPLNPDQGQEEALKTKREAVETTLRHVIGNYLTVSEKSRFNVFAVDLQKRREESAKTGVPIVAIEASDDRFVAEGTADALTLQKRDGSPETLFMTRREDGSVCMLYKDNPDDPGKVVFEAVPIGTKDGGMEWTLNSPNLELAQTWLSHKYVSAFLAVNGYPQDLITEKLRVTMDAGFANRFPDVLAEHEWKVSEYANALKKAFHNYTVQECQNFQDEILGKNVFTTFVKMINKQDKNEEFWVAFNDTGRPVAVYEADKEHGFVPASAVGERGRFIRHVLDTGREIYENQGEPRRSNLSRTERRTGHQDQREKAPSGRTETR